MSDSPYDVLMLDNQICFPLYACAREVIKKYRPFLDELQLTYTQYIAMMVFWEKKKISLKELGGRLLLDSGTLTPVVRSLEQKGYVRRYRSPQDERILLVEITESGEALKEKAVGIPSQVRDCIDLEPDETAGLYRLLYKILAAI